MKNSLPGPKNFTKAASRTTIRPLKGATQTTLDLKRYSAKIFRWLQQGHRSVKFVTCYHFCQDNGKRITIAAIPVSKTQKLSLWHETLRFCWVFLRTRTVDELLLSHHSIGYMKLTFPGVLRGTDPMIYGYREKVNTTFSDFWASVEFSAKIFVNAYNNGVWRNAKRTYFRGTL